MYCTPCDLADEISAFQTMTQLSINVQRSWFGCDMSVHYRTSGKIQKAIKHQFNGHQGLGGSNRLRKPSKKFCHHEGSVSSRSMISHQRSTRAMYSWRLLAGGCSGSPGSGCHTHSPVCSGSAGSGCHTHPMVRTFRGCFAFSCTGKNMPPMCPARPARRLIGINPETRTSDLFSRRPSPRRRTDVLRPQSWHVIARWTKSRLERPLQSLVNR